MKTEYDLDLFNKFEAATGKPIKTHLVEGMIHKRDNDTVLALPALTDVVFAMLAAATKDNDIVIMLITANGELSITIRHSTRHLMTLMTKGSTLIACDTYNDTVTTELGQIHVNRDLLNLVVTSVITSPLRLETRQTLVNYFINVQGLLAVEVPIQLDKIVKKALADIQTKANDLSIFLPKNAGVKHTPDEDGTLFTKWDLKDFTILVERKLHKDTYRGITIEHLDGGFKLSRNGGHLTLLEAGTQDSNRPSITIVENSSADDKRLYLSVCNTADGYLNELEKILIESQLTRTPTNALAPPNPNTALLTGLLQEVIISLKPWDVSEATPAKSM